MTGVQRLADIGGSESISSSRQIAIPSIDASSGEARRVDILELPTAEAIMLPYENIYDPNAVLHVTC